MVWQHGHAAGREQMCQHAMCGQADLLAGLQLRDQPWHLCSTPLLIAGVVQSDNMNGSADRSEAAGSVQVVRDQNGQS